MRQQRRKWEPMARGERIALSAADRQSLKDAGASDDMLDNGLGDEIWLNFKYVATVTKREDGSVAELSIRRQDRKAAHDWRDFQRIKSEIAGREVEAFEIYPAESRLMDTANQYYLFVLPPGERLPAGYVGKRLVSEQAPGKAQQRPLPEDWKEETTP